MPIAEPITTLTDYAIALEALVIALLLFHSGQMHRQPATQLWAVAFVFVAIGAVLGGTCHGFMESLGRELGWDLWRAMFYSLSLASFFMLCASVINTLPYRWRWAGLLGVGAKSLIYLSCVSFQGYYGYVVVDYLSAMAIVLLLYLFTLYTKPALGAVWIISAILVSGIAVMIQASQLTVANIFSASDLYHLVQMIGLYGFYRGVQLQTVHI